MKFQKGLLNDLVPDEPPRKDEAPKPSTARRDSPSPILPKQRPVEKDHLFDTLHEKTGSEKKYVKIFGIVIIGVIALGGVVFYLTLPGTGDAVRGPAGLELAVRDHFLTTQKRTATDIVFYQCDGYYDARVGVETRNDLPNPLFRLGTYSARARHLGEQWEVTAAPLPSPADFVPCK